MNPNSTWTRPDPAAERDEEFVAKFLEREGMKAVHKTAVVLDLDEVRGCWADTNDPAAIVERLRETNSFAAQAIADQIEAQTRPPKPPEPTGLGAVAEDAEGVRWTRVYALPNRVAWKDAEGKRLCAEWAQIDHVMTTPIFTGLLASCTCSDRESAAVAELVARGVDQWDASLVIYGATPAWDAPLPVWRVWIAQQVADLFAPLARRWGA